MAFKCYPRQSADLKASEMEIDRLLRACVVALAFLAAAVSARPALAQANFDRPGSDYVSAPVISDASAPSDSGWISVST